MRIGDRHNVKIEPLRFDDYELKWQYQIKYLGIVILSARKFTINFQNVKQRYFRSLNGIFGKIGNKSSPVVLCSLINSYCTPILLYALETLCLSNKLINSIEIAYNQAFFKVFSTFDKDVVSQCQFYMGYLPLRTILDIRKLSFLTKIMSVEAQPIGCSIVDEEYVMLCNKYDIACNGRQSNSKYFAWKHFQNVMSTRILGILSCIFLC